MAMPRLCHLLFVLFVCFFVGHAVNKIDEFWLPVFRRVVFSRDEIWQRDGRWLQYITIHISERWRRGFFGALMLKLAKNVTLFSYTVLQTAIKLSTVRGTGG